MKDWNDIKLLAVAVDRLRQWSLLGLQCIGDCGHAMSPMGGVGINLAIQDAVATANILARPLLQHAKVDEELAAVQKRQEFPTRVTQSLQVFAHKRFVSPALTSRAPLHAMPPPLKLLRRFALLRLITARIMGTGVRAEHVCTPVAVRQRVENVKAATG